jgi:voltage-gated potassium channel
MNVAERACRRLVEHPAFDTGVVLLILLSVVLLAFEIALPPDHLLQPRMLQVQHWITALFVAELGVRFTAARNRRGFLQDYWLDILAVLPYLRVFRFARFLRLLRLLRLVRLASLLARNSRVSDMLTQGQVGEYVLAGILTTLAVVWGTLSLSHFEHPHQGTEGLLEAFWRVLLILISGEVPHEPATWGGRLVVFAVAAAGLGVVAVLVGTISAWTIEAIQRGALQRTVSLEETREHLVVCGWNSGVPVALGELQKHPDFRNKTIVVIADRDQPAFGDLPAPRQVKFLRDDFTRVEVLQRANIMAASVAIIVSDVSHSRSRQDADARTVLAALTIEKMNPHVYTCAELSNRMNEPHLRMGKVNEVVVTQDMAGRLLAQAALQSAHLRVLEDLLEFGHGSRLETRPLPEALVGQEFGAVLSTFLQSTGALPIAVVTRDGGIHVNPVRHILAATDQLVCIEHM